MFVSECVHLVHHRLPLLLLTRRDTEEEQEEEEIPVTPRALVLCEELKTKERVALGSSSCYRCCSCCCCVRAKSRKEISNPFDKVAVKWWCRQSSGGGGPGDEDGRGRVVQNTQSRESSRGEFQGETKENSAEPPRNG